MPISDCQVRDPRVQRTRELLQRALGKLLQSRSLDEILVQDITDEATLNRATFYDHYADKFTLYEAIVAGGFHQLLHERNIHFDGTCPSGVNAVILAVCDYLTQTHTGAPIVPSNGASAPLLDAAITSVLRRVLLEGLSNRANKAVLKPEMIAGMASSAIYGAVKEWLPLSNRPSAERFAQIIVQLVLPMLHSDQEPLRPVQKIARQSPRRAE